MTISSSLFCSSVFVYSTPACLNCQFSSVFVSLHFPQAPLTSLYLDKCFHSFTHLKMGGQASNQLTVAKALEIAKENQNGQMPPAVTQLLERNIGDIWRRIQAQPSTYVMKREEFAVFTFYRSRYDNNAVAQQAVARFWNHYNGDAARVDGARSSSSTPSASGGPASPRGQGPSGGR